MQAQTITNRSMRLTINRILLLFACITFAISSSYGQIAYKFIPFGMEDGLSSNMVNDVFKDSKGYIWIATNNGLNRFDDYRILQYYKDYDPDNIQSNRFWAVKEDGNGVFWIGVKYSDCTLYYPDKDQFDCNYISYLHKLGLKFIPPHFTIRIDADRNLWLWDDENVNYYDFSKKEWYHFNLFHVTEVYVRNKKAYIVQNDFVIDIISLNNRDIKVDFSLKEQFGITSEGMPRIFVDSRENIWVYDRQHEILAYKEKGDDTWINPSPDNGDFQMGVKSISEDPYGMVLLAIENNSLFYFDREAKKICQMNLDSKLLQVGTVSKITSFSNSIWLLFKHEGTAFAVVPQQGFLPQHKHKDELDFLLKNVNVTSFINDKENNIWISTEGKGIYVITNGESEILRHFDIEDKNNTVTSLFYDSSNRVWANTYNDGIYIFSDVFSTPLHINKNERGLLNDNVWATQEDKQGNIWIGHQREGIQKWDKDKNTFLPPTIPNIATSDIALSPKGEFLIATPNGHIHLSPTTGKYSACEKEISIFKRNNNLDRGIFRITYDSRGWIWTGGISGLIVWGKDESSSICIGTAEGLCNDVIHGIVEDDNHNMWITTEYGLARIIIPDGVTEPKLTDFKIQNFSVIDGIRTNQFMTGALTKLHNGTVLAGSTDGIIIINPGFIQEERNHGSVYITEIQLSADSLCSSVDTTVTYRIENGESAFIVHFSTLSGIITSQYRYAYRLKSSDDWSFTTNSELVFSHLLPGHYTLELCLAHNIEDGDITRLNFYICYPWYLTWKAFIAYALLIILAVYYYQHEREKRLSLSEQIADLQSKFQLTMEKRQSERLVSEITNSPIEVNDEDNKLEKDAIKIIEANIDNSEFSVEQLSRELGMSRGNLHRKLVVLTGKGPLAFIRSVKLKYAKELLTRSNLSISEISYSTGFNSPKLFSRHFKEEYGKLPSEFRESIADTENE